MTGAGGEWGNRLTLFAARLLACSEGAYGGEGGKQNAGGVNGIRDGTGFKTGDGGAGCFDEGIGCFGPEVSILASGGRQATKRENGTNKKETLSG